MVKRVTVTAKSEKVFCRLTGGDDEGEGELMKGKIGYLRQKGGRRRG